MMYAQDYDECWGFTTWYDCYDTSNNWRPGAMGWPISLQPYIKNRQMLVCPSDSEKACCSKPGGSQGYFPMLQAAGYNPAEDTQAALAAAFPLSYAANVYLGWSQNANSMAQIANPAKCFLVSELGKGSYNYSVWYMYPGYGTPTRWEAGARHHDGRNFMFADGHVKWVKELCAPGTATATVVATYQSYGVYTYPATE